PHAVVEPGHRKEMHALGRHLLADIAAERSIDRLVRIARGGKRERHLLGLGDRHHGADDAAMRVKNWISPESSFWNASGSPPGSLSFSGCTVVSTRPSVSARTESHMATRLR